MRSDPVLEIRSDPFLNEVESGPVFGNEVGSGYGFGTEVGSGFGFGMRSDPDPVLE